ncbi:Hypothetical_protein [Hexamita inflata]|uniref:Hypothetical_protein n=1 Tax=Hexamita inflata TaxID=28002 RepID=A0AA86NSB6_9EUKA|nr:Hypothetical protein HINF_LOCUS12775 [Hexamita inflata]
MDLTESQDSSIDNLDSDYNSQQNVYDSSDLLPDELRNQIQYNKLIVEINQMKDIEFLNNFDIEELDIYYCKKLFQSQITKKLRNLYYITVKSNVQMSFNYLISKHFVLVMSQNMKMEIVFFKVYHNLKNLKNSSYQVTEIQIYN